MTRLATIARRLIADIEQTLAALLRKYPAVDPVTVRSIAKTYGQGLAMTKPELFIEWVVKNVAEGHVRWAEDAGRLIEPWAHWLESKDPAKIDRYREVVQRLFPGKNVRNVLDFSLQDLEQVDDAIENYDIEAKRQKLETKLPAGTELIYNDGTYQIVRVKLIFEKGRDAWDVQGKSTQAVCYYSQGTRWCTSDPETSRSYLDESAFYIVFQESKKLAMFHPEVRQIKDLRNRPLDLRQHPGLLGILDKLGATDPLVDLIDEVMDSDRVFNFLAESIHGPWPKLEKKLRDLSVEAEEFEEMYDYYRRTIRKMKAGYPSS